jgi:hypothetical protein
MNEDSITFEPDDRILTDRGRNQLFPCEPLKSPDQMLRA